ADRPVRSSARGLRDQRGAWRIRRALPRRRADDALDGERIGLLDGRERDALVGEVERLLALADARAEHVAHQAGRAPLELEGAALPGAAREGPVQLTSALKAVFGAPREAALHDGGEVCRRAGRAPREVGRGALEDLEHHAAL